MTTGQNTAQPPRVIVCVGKNCGGLGCGARIYERLQAMLDEADPLHPPFKLRVANCFDRCEEGPNMMIYPGGRCFDHLDVEKAVQIVMAEVAASQDNPPE